MNFKEILEQGNNLFLPNLSIDLVIIGYQEGKLKCLLLKIGPKWLLPGGYIRLNESVEQAVYSILKERTGLEHAYLKFLSVFGDENRQFKGLWKEFIEKIGIPWKDDYWFNNRFVTLAYYALVNIANTHPSISVIDKAFGWYDIDELPEMWMDHKSIVLTAKERLKEDVRHNYNTYNLLPDKFTMPELHQLHQKILEEQIDRSRFQKKMLSTGMFERLPQLKKSTPGRNPYLYKVKKEM